MNKEIFPEYTACTLCPRACGTDRASGAAGFCGAGSEMRVGRAGLHLWEEPCLAGSTGAGAVFFCHCSLRCVFCQNAVISGREACESGKPVSPEDLAETFFALEEQGAVNIDLVTPTHYTPSVRRAMELARSRGLKIPFVWNSSGYETAESLRTLDGLVDCYLPDFKYCSSYYAGMYSAAPDYFETACDAVDEMVRQTGAPVMDGNGILRRGTVVRHLMLPGLAGDTSRVLRAAARRWGDKILFSLMRQFTPQNGTEAHPELSRRLTDAEYEDACAEMRALGLNGYLQDSESVSESFIPVFDGSGIRRSR